MKHLLLTTIAAVVLLGCVTKQSAPAPEAKTVKPAAEAPAQPPSPVESQPAEPVVVDTQPEPPTVKAPGISIHEAAEDENIEAVKQHLAVGTDVNAKDRVGETPLHYAARHGHKVIVELLIVKGANVNAKTSKGMTPLNASLTFKALNDPNGETTDLLRKHGGKTGEELKAEGK